MADYDYKRVKCPGCGTKTLISRDMQDFCSKCGLELDYLELRKRNGKAQIKWIIIIFIILIGLVAIMIPFFPQVLFFILGFIIMIGVVILVLIFLSAGLL